MKTGGKLSRMPTWSWEDWERECSVCFMAPAYYPSVREQVEAGSSWRQHSPFIVSLGNRVV